MKERPANKMIVVKFKITKCAFNVALIITLMFVYRSEMKFSL